MPQLPATETAEVAVPPDELFDWFVGSDLSELLEGYGPLDAVTKTTDQTGPWDEEGSQRTVHLSGGNTVRQTVIDCEPPEYFAYRVDGFAAPVGLLSPKAISQWRFEPSSEGTAITWTYTHYTDSWLAKLAFYPAALLWEGYMRQIIETVERKCEREIG